MQLKGFWKLALYNKKTLKSSFPYGEISLMLLILFITCYAMTKNASSRASKSTSMVACVKL